MKKFKPSYSTCAFLFAITYFLLINLINISNPILERHSFRQTQTALSAYYLLDNLHFSYITPVLGEPESIPFEFPIYQAIVGFFSKICKINLDIAGRLVSLIFSLAVFFPIKGIFNKFLIQDDFYKLVAAGILFSPVYSFWSGTFMIESTALFFAISGVFYVFKSLDRPAIQNILLALFLLTLALLQKITTAIFVYALVVFYIGFIAYSRQKSNRLSKYAMFFLASIIPFVIAYSWVAYTDNIKSQNPIALIKLTSQALGAWNYGTISQRFSQFFYLNTIYLQDIFPNAFFGLLALFSLKFVFLGEDRKLRLFVASLLFLYLAPLIIFTNLFWIHDYYHYANIIYLACFSYLGFLLSLKNSFFNKFKYYILTASYAVSIITFYIEYAPAKFSHMLEVRTMNIAKFIRSSSSPQQQVVVFGYDWSSEVHYYAQRKGLAVPNWVDQSRVANNLSAYISDPNPLIAVCESPGQDFKSVLDVLAVNYYSFDAKFGCIFYYKKVNGH